MKRLRSRGYRLLAGLAVTAVFGTDVAVGAHTIQASIDLSGNWVLDEIYVKKDGPRLPFCARECQITQDKVSLTVKVGNTVATYRLDGVPVKSTQRWGEFTTERVVTARWEGRRLVIATKTGDGPETRVALSIEEGKLVISSNTRGFEVSSLESKVTYTRRPARHPLPLQRP